MKCSKITCFSTGRHIDTDHHDAGDTIFLGALHHDDGVRTPARDREGGQELGAAQAGRRGAAEVGRTAAAGGYRGAARGRAGAGPRVAARLPPG